MHYIYFDNAASTKPAPVVSSSFEYINNEYYANPSAAHLMGVEAEKILDSSRNSIASFLGLKNSSIIFTSGGTESINLALRGSYKAGGRNRNRIITTKVEHASTYETVRDLEKEGAEIVFIGQDSRHELDLGSLYRHLDKNTLLVSLIHINNESGVINPIRKISELIKGYDPEILIHADLVQSFGKFDLKDKIDMIDLFSCSAHKIHGPKGTGILGIKDGVRLLPAITGGGQEKNMRSGTLDLPLIYAFANVVSELKENYVRDLENIRVLKEHLLEKLAECGPEHHINFPYATSPYILNVSFPGVKSEILMHFLEEKNIMVSAGSACSSRTKKNRVLKYYGLPERLASSAIRISFSRYNTVGEADILFDALCEIVTKIKGI